MRRQDKYKDTDTFHFYNANPKGKYTDDCVIRAIATATKIPYTNVLEALVRWQIKTGYTFTDDRCFGKYLEELGWTKMRQPRKSDNTKYEGHEFCVFLARPTERYIATIGSHHIVAIVDEKVYDTWDSTNGCIGNYWVK